MRMEPVKAEEDDELTYSEFMRRPSTAPHVGGDLQGLPMRTYNQGSSGV